MTAPMTVWDFLDKLFKEYGPQVGSKLDGQNEQLIAIRATLDRLEALMSTVKEEVQAYAGQVNDFSNAAATAIQSVLDTLHGYQSQLAAASSPAEVAAIMDPAMVNLKTIGDSLVALAAEGQPTVPPAPEPLTPAVPPTPEPAPAEEPL